MPLGLDPAMRWARRLLFGLLVAAALAWGAIALAAWAVSAPPGEPAGEPSDAARAAASDYLAALAPMPEGWRPARFAPEPGVSLEVGRLDATAPRQGTVVFVPGYTAPLDLFGAEYARLAAAGWDVAAISQRGQGRSDRFGAAHDMGHVEDYADLTRDLAAWTAEQEGPVALMGVSKGAHTVLRTLAERETDVIGAVAVVPMVAIRTEPFPPLLARALGEVADRSGLGRRYAPGPGAWDRAERFLDDGFVSGGTVCTDDPARAHLRDALFTLDPALRVDAPSLGWVAATMRSTAALPGMAETIAAPVLMVTATEDRIVSTEAASALCAAMPDCAEVALEGPHCLLEGRRDRAEAVMDAALGFLDGLAAP